MIGGSARAHVWEHREQRSIGRKLQIEENKSKTLAKSLVTG